MIARTGPQALRIVGPGERKSLDCNRYPRPRLARGQIVCTAPALTPGQNNLGLRRSLGEERPLSPARQVS